MENNLKPAKSEIPELITKQNKIPKFDISESEVKPTTGFTNDPKNELKNEQNFESTNYDLNFRETESVLFKKCIDFIDNSEIIAKEFCMKADLFTKESSELVDITFKLSEMTKKRDYLFDKVFRDNDI